MASITPMSFFTPDASINPDDYTFEIVDAAARSSIASIFNLKNFPTAADKKSNVNLNNTYLPGLYLLEGNISECPYGSGYGYLVVYSSEPQNGVPQNVRQIFYPAGTDVVFERRRYQGTWNAWYRITEERDVSVTAVNGTLGNVSVIQEGKLVSGYIEITRLTAAANSWLNLCRISVHPNVQVFAHAFRNKDGGDCGIIRFNPDQDMVHVYSINALNDASINFMFSYRTQ